MTARNDPFSLDINGIDLASMDHQILNSHAFKVWVNQKTVHEGVVFFNEEHALCEYIHEFAYGFPSPTFMWEPNDLGMFSVHASRAYRAEKSL
jgi:hypothetical protein